MKDKHSREALGQRVADLENRVTELKSRLAGYQILFETFPLDVSVPDRSRVENDLRRSEALYRMIVENSIDGFWQLDTNGKVTYVSPAIENILGYTVEEALPLNFTAFFPEIELKRARETFDMAIGGLEHQLLEFSGRRKDGSTVPLEVSLSPIKQGDDIIGVQGIARDITDRRVAEELSRVNYQKYRIIYEHSPIAIELYDATGRLMDVNPACLKLFGVQRIRELEDFKLFDDPNLPENFKEKLRAGQDVHYQTTFDFEKVKRLNLYQTTRKGIVWLDVMITSLGGESPIGYLVQVQDITERKLAKARLLESEERYRLLAENVSDVIWTMDLEQNFTFVSPSIMELRGYSPEEAITQSLEKMLTPESYQIALDILAVEWDKIQAGTLEPVDIELEFTRKDGSTVWGESVITVIYDAAGEPQSILGITRDTTQRRQLDESREQLLEFLAGEMRIQKAVVEEAKNVLEVREFPVVARSIFDAACKLIGARSGYVALLSENGAENEVLFLESGGFDCTVDPALPMPVRGLRAEAYKTGRVAVDNDFANSRWMDFMPAGHVKLANVLFAPLNIAGRTVGLMGLANKPDDFTEKDRVIAQSFGQLAAMALNNSRNLALLEDNEAFLRETGRIARTGGWELDAANMTVKWTEETYRIHELPLDYQPPLEEAINFFHPDDRELLSTSIRNALDHGQPYDLETRFITATGRHLWARSVCQPVVENGKVVRLKGIFQDITARKQAEEKLKKSLQEKELLLSEVHHRVKNNLQIISSLINLQINELTHEETIRYLKETQSRIQAMAFIHEGLYAAESMSAVNIGVHLKKIVNAVSQSYGGGATRIRLKVTADDIRLSLTQAVPVGLVVNELLTNAYKHAFTDRQPDGEISIIMQKLAEDRIELIINDNGVGMPESMDWRGSSSFGLSLAVSLVEQQLDGSIILARDQGTTFRIVFAKDV